MSAMRHKVSLTSVGEKEGSLWATPSCSVTAGWTSSGFFVTGAIVMIQMRLTLEIREVEEA